MRHGRYGLVAPRGTTAKGDKKTQKHTHGRPHRFGPCDPLLLRPCAHEIPESVGLKAFRLLTECAQERDDR